MTVSFRIIGTELPGRACDPATERPGGYRNIHVGIQRGQEVIDLVPGDAARAEFAFDVTVRSGRLGGPFVHGRNPQRFFYLSWGEVDGDEFRMFRRAKLHVEHLDAGAIDGHEVVGSLTLTDAKGHPLCAAVRPPRISWTVR